MRKDYVNYAGYFFLILWIISTSVSFYLGEFSAVFWFCNLSVVVAAIACFEKSHTLMTFVLAQGLFFQTPWIVDWTVYLFSGYSFFSLAEFYAGAPTYFMILTFIRHTLTVPLVAVLLFFTGFRPIKFIHSLFWSFGTVILLFISYLLPVNKNVNCIHYFCSPSLAPSFTGAEYSFLWASIALLAFYLSVYLIVLPLERYFRKLFVSKQHDKV